jgi:hypothetical protein
VLRSKLVAAMQRRSKPRRSTATRKSNPDYGTPDPACRRGGLSSAWRLDPMTASLCCSERVRGGRKARPTMARQTYGPTSCGRLAPGERLTGRGAKAYWGAKRSGLFLSLSASQWRRAPFRRRALKRSTTCGALGRAPPPAFAHRSV